MSNGRIDELSFARDIPHIDELVVPIYMDHTNQAVQRIGVADLARMVRDRVLSGSAIKMVLMENGIKFIPESEVETDG